jgi:hypothetical protein
VPSTSAVLNVVVRVAGIVPVRVDLAYVGTPEQQVGLSLGTVLVYLRPDLLRPPAAQLRAVVVLAAVVHDHRPGRAQLASPDAVTVRIERSPSR